VRGAYTVVLQSAIPNFLIVKSRQRRLCMERRNKDVLYSTLAENKCRVEA
jgi:hypothetical protein